MINVIAFILFGAILYVGADIAIARDKRDFTSLKTNVRMWQWWVGMFIYMIFWPMVLGNALYKATCENESLSD